MFWSFVQGTMPTMGEGRYVLRRGPLADFRVAVPASPVQTEIASMVRMLMATAIDMERMHLKTAINEAVLGILGHSSNVEPEMSHVVVDLAPFG